MNYDAMNAYRTKSQRDNRFHRLRKWAIEMTLVILVSGAFWGMVAFLALRGGQ